MRHVLLGILFLGSPVAGAQDNSRFDLVCHADRGGIALDTYLYVDPEPATVNGEPASITDDEITWRRETEKTEFRYSVNRISGAMSVTGFDKKSGKAFSTEDRTCESTTERKYGPTEHGV